MKESALGEKLFPENGKQAAPRLCWDDARAFLAVARAGALSGAAEVTGSGIATVTRKIERLEIALGVKLFSRHQTGYQLTEDGAALLEKAEKLEEVAAEFSAAATTGSEVAGRVRLATAETLANHLIIPRLPLLVSAYPGLSLEIVTDVQTLNLHRRDADIALRLTRPSRGNVHVQKLGSLRFGLYAASSYIDSRKQSGAEFDNDRMIGWTEDYAHLPAAAWLAKTLRNKPPVLSTSTISAQLSAAMAGIGCAVLPHFLGHRHNLSCLQAELGVEQEIWLVIHSDLAQSRRIRVVRDFLERVIRDPVNELTSG